MDAGVWRQAKGVLAEALLCPPNERDAWVAERCTDPLLRREVQAYLDQYDANFLETVLTVANTIDLVTPSDTDEAPDVQPGEHIGPYVVLKRLGIGGMGHVFLGNDTRLHRKVALKCLIGSGSGGDFRSRILHEARAAARINHPNIAVVHDVIDHDGRPFLVMEYVEGESLEAVLRRERPPVETILTMGRQLASALVAAHAKGIIHRDLKPANIQVMPDGSVKILDFGVAQAMSMLVSETPKKPTETIRPTHAAAQGERGALVHPGTPGYMSPEQMFGQEIDPRSDIYSLGVVLHEMATGQRPYPVDNPLDIVLALSSLLRPAGLDTNLPPEVSDVIGKMLAVKVDERFQTAAELETALGALIRTEPAMTFAARPSASRTRTAVRVAGVVLLVGAAIALLGFIQTAAFNLTLGRMAPFDQESPARWVEFGLRALVLPTVLLVGIIVAVSAVKFMLRVLSLSRGIDHLLTTGISTTSRLGLRLGLNDPVVLGQAVAGVGVILLGGLMWRFWPFIRAWGTASISTKPAEQFLPLQPVGRSRLDAQLYVYSLTALAYFFSIAIVRLQRLRASQPIRRGGAALVLVATMLTITILLCLAPYRIEWQNEMERIDVAGERCYVIAEQADDWLIHCPDRTPPRNRVIKRGDRAVHDLGVVQNIFNPPDTSPK
jgi:hypothetical protein